MSEIVLNHVSKAFPGGVKAVDDVQLTVASGEFMVLVGPSGCGKTTLLRMIAGIEDVSEGSVSIGGRDVTDLASRYRDVAMVFQNYALYPHLSVRKNLGYGLKVRHTPKDEIERRVARAGKLLGLEELFDRRPSALSGGQRQRVAMGRAIVREPQAFLMDEPLSNLDAKLRVTMRSELAQLHERLRVTTVYVTHDQVEAMTLGQRVAVMRDGKIQQVDTPQTLYERPTNLFVAAFIGSPSMNFVEATIRNDVLEFGSHHIALDPACRPERDGEVILGIRPEDFEHAELAYEGLPTIQVTASIIELLGGDIHVIFPVDVPQFEAEDTRAAHDDEEVHLLADTSTSMFTARLRPGPAIQQGQSLTLAVNNRAFHFFDPQTSRSLDVDRRAAAVNA